MLDSGVDLDDVFAPVGEAACPADAAGGDHPVPGALVRNCPPPRGWCPLSPSRLLLVVITDNGRVEQRMVTLSADIDERDSAGCVTCSPSPCTASGWKRHRRPWPKPTRRPTTSRHHVVRVATVLVETLVERGDDRLILGGTSNLARSASDFTPAARWHGLGA